jgi:hypothetical protein
MRKFDIAFCQTYLLDIPVALCVGLADHGDDSRPVIVAEEWQLTSA